MRYLIITFGKVDLMSLDLRVRPIMAALRPIPRPIPLKVITEYEILPELLLQIGCAFTQTSFTAVLLLSFWKL